MDSNLIDALKNNSQSAFRTLVDEYQQMVFSTCKAIVHDIDDADDITQEVFIETFKTIHKFRADAKLSTWLYRIAINKSLNFIRDNKRNKMLRRLGLLEGKENIVSEPDLNFNEEERKIYERKKAIENAIDALPKNQRTAFILCKYDDLSYREISEIMEVSVSSVESLLFRARKSLQKNLLNFYKSSRIE